MMNRALVLVALLAPASASAYQLRTDPTGATVHQAQQEITFRLPARIPAGLDEDAVKAAVKGAAASWAEVTGLKINVVEGDADAKPGYAAGGQNHNDILFVEQGWSWDDEALATTIITVDTSTHTILDADIVLNAAQHRFRTLPADHSPGGIYDDVQNTLTHEFGHALGLAHSSVPEATMYAGAPKGETAKRTLEADDIDGARSLYQDGAATGSQAGGASTTLKDMGLGSVGCASTGQAGASGWLALALLPLVALKRRAT